MGVWSIGFGRGGGGGGFPILAVPYGCPSSTGILLFGVYIRCPIFSETLNPKPSTLVNPHLGFGAPAPPYRRGSDG